MTPPPGASWWIWRYTAPDWARRGDENEEPTSGSRLVPVNLDRSHFRSARWWLLAEAVLLLALGIAGLIAGQPHHAGVAGAADRELALPRSIAGC
jgi:hypothetical protein